MEKVKIEFVVGLFVLVGILCLGYLSIKLGKLELIGGNVYEVVAQFNSASGLKPGSAVEIAGVEVGRVRGITLKEDRAAVILAVDNSVKLYSDTIASIKTRGIIGEKFLALSPGVGAEAGDDGGQVMTGSVSERPVVGKAVRVGIALVLFLCAGLAAEKVWAGGATDAMKSTIDEVLRILQDKDLKQPAKVNERRQLLEKVVGDRFDYQEMSRRALGAPWANLSDKEKEEFVSLFQTLLVNSYADKVEAYSGEGVQYINERTEKDYAEVRTKVMTGKTEIPLDYRLLNKASVWRVYDVVVDGVSLVNNYRGQFTKILRSGSYGDLVDQLRRKSEKIKTQ